VAVDSVDMGRKEVSRAYRVEKSLRGRITETMGDGEEPRRV
jgi:hypothetical protein